MSHILIVDDDVENRTILKLRLELAGHQVTEGTNGEEGLALALSCKPDLIFLDVMMPKIDGWQVCRTLKANPLTHAIPIIMLTACSQQIEELRGYESGADDYLTKPWNPEHLRKVVEKQLLSIVPKAVDNH